MAAALESEVKAIESEVKAVVNKVKEKETLAATSGRRADGLFSHATRSKRFKRAVDRVFDRVDIDKSGTIDEAELLVALLLLQHTLNKLPLNKYEPPEQAEVKRLLVEFGRELAGRLTRAEFHALAEHLFRGVGVAMLRHTACVLLLAPLIGFVVKSLAQAYATEQLGLPDKRAKLVKIVPDSLFAPVASAAVAVAGWKASAGAGI